MAEVRIGRSEATQGRLPPVCIRCGKPASAWVRKLFDFQPNWMSRLAMPGVTLLAGLVLREREQIIIPFCERHKNHWLVHRLWMGGSLVLIPLFAIALMAANEDQVAGFMFGLMLGFFLWSVIAVIAHETSVHAKDSETTEHSLTFVHVADDFAKAVNLPAFAKAVN